MKRISSFVLALALLSPLGGCFVHTGPGHSGKARKSGCGPAHHWENGHCVHNGNGRGNGKGKGHKK
jgi:hypothetical protein